MKDCDVAAQLGAVVDQREDAAVVHGIAVAIAQRRSGREPRLIEYVQASSLGDVDDALEQRGFLVQVAIKEAQTAALAQKRRRSRSLLPPQTPWSM